MLKRLKLLRRQTAALPPIKHYEWKRTGIVAVLVAAIILLLLFSIGPLIWLVRISYFELRAFWREVIQSSANG